MGPWSFAASIVNVVVGATIFRLPAALAASAGLYAPLAILVCAVIMVSIAICFGEAGSRVPTSGGPYGYVEEAFGPLAGFIAGVLLWFCNVLACGGIIAALADVVVSVAPPAIAGAVRVGVIVGVIGGIALVNIAGVARGARLINGGTLLKLIPLALFLVLGAGAVHLANFTQSVTTDTAGLGRALILAVFAFTGMETSLCAGGEVTQPARTIPRGLAIAMLFVAFLYGTIQLVAQGILGTALPQSTVPLADAMARTSPALSLLMLVGAAVSMLSWAASDILGSPRILFAMARDGFLPRALGRVNARTHTPYVAILAHAAVGIALALTGSFAELAVLSTLTVAPLYMGGCAAAWQLAARRVALAGEPLNFRWLKAAAAIGGAGMLALIGMASKAEIIGLAAILAASVALYLLQRRLSWGSA